MRRFSVSLALALAAAAVVAPTASASRVYAGQPSGSSPVQFVFNVSDDGTKLTSTTFHFEQSCGTDFDRVDNGTPIFVDDEPDRVTLGDHYLIGGRISGGRLRGTTILGMDAVDETTIDAMNAVFTGTVGRTRASGRVSIRYVRVNITTGQVLAQCNRNVRWRALRDPGSVFAGSTSQDEPVVLELTDDREVSHAHVAWYADCQAGGFVSNPHDEFDLEPFPLSATGRFSRRYRFGYGYGNAVERFAGRVSGTRASGTFSARMEFTTPGEEDTCSSGQVSWRATTG